MGDLGKLLPHASSLNGETKNIQEWRVPIAVFNADKGDPFKVVAVYENEGILCIDIEVPNGS